MPARGFLALALVCLAAGAHSQPAPPPAELTLEQFLAQRGWSAVQLRENEFMQLEADVVLNGRHRMRVQISTSFSKTVIDEAVAKALGLRVEPSGVEITGARKQRLGTLRLESLAFGDTRLGAATVFTADLPALLNRSGSAGAVQGVIGADLLTKYQAVLEIPTATLYLRVR